MEIDRGLDRLKENLRWIFADNAKLRAFLEQKGQPAQVWLDRMQQLAEHPKTSPDLRSSIFTIMLRLSKKSKLHPTCLRIQNVRKMGEYPIAAGGFGDVWKGVIGESTEPVCLKVVKIYQNSDAEKLSTEYIREAIVWRQLQHPNLLPFLGIYHLEHDRQICLISPWMEKGNLVQYLKKTPREDVEHHTLVHDVAAGLCYLHSRKIVHGDLKGVNVLMTDSGRACIGDFGLARVADTHGIRVTTSSSRSVGTGRWLAPELLNGGVTSKESDMYAYGCVCYEIFTGAQPFPELHNEMAVAIHVLQGKRMSRPQHITELSDQFWAIMESCWEAVPSSRPSVDNVLSKINLTKEKSLAEGSDWSDSLSSEIWNNVEHQSVDEILPGEDIFWNLDRKITHEANPDLGLIVKLITDGTFSRHGDFDLAFLEEDTLNGSLSELPTFHVSKTELYSSFKGRVAQYFHLTEDQFRLWVFVHRWNGTLRPDTSIPNTNQPYMTMDFIRASVSTERLRILPLYLDVISWHSVLSPFGLATQGPLNGTFKSAALEQEIMIFLKHFDPSQQTLCGVGKVWASRSSLLATLLPRIRKRMRWNSFTDVKLFEEVKPGQIQVLAPERSFEEAGVMNHGDVICFQIDLEESDLEDYIRMRRNFMISSSNATTAS
ncbi:kinase-like protein [Marasmius fiardii PR-910]|nr:kinase-like protein [Marasmius fiardii PR-910]